MRLVHTLLAAAVAAVAASSAAAATIDFDNLTGGPTPGDEMVTTQYVASLGVTFFDTNSGGALANTSLGALIPGSTAPNVLFTSQGNGSLTGQYLQISFANAVGDVSALFGTSLSADITLAAYSGNALIDSVTEIGSVITQDVRSGTISLPDDGITSVRLYSTSSSSSFNFSIDNLTFQTQPVPEPATYALMALGLAGVGVAARRRSRR